MRTTGYSLILVLGSLLALFSTASIVQFADPQAVSRLVMFSLYASVFLSVTGIFSLSGTGVRYFIIKERFDSSLWVSFRQGLLLAVLVTASLGLQADRLLYWWVELSLVLFLSVVEILFNI